MNKRGLLVFSESVVFQTVFVFGLALCYFGLQTASYFGLGLLDLTLDFLSLIEYLYHVHFGHI
jgi:hypothetical protein